MKSSKLLICRAREALAGTRGFWSPCCVHWAALSLIACLFAAIADLSVVAAEPVYKIFGREAGGYSSKDDVPGIVKKELGAKATIADWQEIRASFGQSEAILKGFCDKAGLAPQGSACVTRGGKRFWQEQRQYFIYRADHKVPDDFMVHDQLQNNLLLLGSRTDARPVLVKMTDSNAAGAARWEKSDKAIQAAAKNDFSGSYTLVSVDGKKVPTAVSHEGATLQIRSGSFIIAADGTCTSKMTFVPPSGVESTMEVKATSIREGLTLKMQWAGAGTTTGKVQGDTFTMENEGMVFLYKK